MSTPFELAILRTLAQDATSLRDEDSPDTLPDWDSHTQLELLSQLEEGYQITFTLDEQLELGSIGDIKAALRTRGIHV